MIYSAINEVGSIYDIDPTVCILYETRTKITSIKMETGFLLSFRKYKSSDIS